MVEQEYRQCRPFRVNVFVETSTRADQTKVIRKRRWRTCYDMTTLQRGIHPYSVTLNGTQSAGETLVTFLAYGCPGPLEPGQAPRDGKCPCFEPPLLPKCDQSQRVLTMYLQTPNVAQHLHSRQTRCRSTERRTNWSQSKR